MHWRMVHTPRCLRMDWRKSWWRRMLVTIIYISIISTATSSSSKQVMSSIVLTNPVFNSSALSISSLHFHSSQASSTPSPWVQKLFGAEAVFWNRRDSAEHHEYDLPHHSFVRSLSIVQEFFNFNESHLRPICALELLGFVMVDAAEPFLIKDKHIKPAVGYGSIQWKEPSGVQTTWTCYYRATYDNWRHSEFEHTKPHYWPVFIYCPIQSTQQCNVYRTLHEYNKTQSISQDISLVLADRTWHVAFESQWNLHFDKESLDPKNSHSHQKKRAICTAIPYKTWDNVKELALEAIFFEWIRYYTLLGFEVIMYDKDAQNWPGLFSTPYSKRASIKPYILTMMKEHLHYYNYTILSQLSSSFNNMQYDNEEGLNDRIYKFDDDHTLSLTHCRFDARARLGIEQVIITDADEFLYCRAGKDKAFTQRMFIHNLLNMMDAQRLDQATFMQRVVSNKTQLAIKDCVLNELIAARNPSNHNASIFNCFASYNHLIQRQSPKSIHLNLACPLTTDHHATAVTSMNLRDYDCLGTNLHVVQCSFVHLSLRDADYIPRHYRLRSSYQPIQQHFPKIPSELANIVLGLD